MTLSCRFHFSGPEIMFTAEQQLEAAGGIGDTPFVTMKLTIDEKSQIIVEAFQVLCNVTKFKRVCFAVILVSDVDGVILVWVLFY